MSDDIKVVISQKGTIPVYTSTQVGGVSNLDHDDTLKGNGTSAAPLGISALILEKIKRGGDTFVFEFDASQTSWTIQHNLGKKPSITVVDSADNVITCEREYIGFNSVKISFNAAFKGTAYLN